MSTKYEVTICDGEECKVVASKKKSAAAEKQALRELRKKAKRLKGGKKNGRVYAAVYRKEDGVVDTNPVWEGEERYGEPQKRRGRRPKKQLEPAQTDAVDD